jgi:tRNA ligase
MAAPSLRAHPATSLEDSQLITRLFNLSQKNKKLVKSNLHDAPADPSIKVRSWKMDEFKYYVVPSPFPTLARGLFTISLKGAKTEEQEQEHDSGSDTENDHEIIRHRIVVRGYDKFFNIGEVPWTTWASLEAHTKPPYTLSLKSNGCIIFIGALTPSKLLVTSKHSLGVTANEEELSHAKVGEKWLRKYLSDKGKTEAELASTLWDNNWTAIAEVSTLLKL